MCRIHPRHYWGGLYAPPPGYFCTDPRLKSRFRPRIGPGCGCRGGLGRGWVECWGARRDVDRWLPRRAGARAALGLLALIPSRKLLHRSPVKVAVPATNRAGLRLPGGLGRGWGIGAPVDEFKRTARRDMHGREARVCVRARVYAEDGLVGKRTRPLIYPSPLLPRRVGTPSAVDAFLAAGPPRVPDSGAPIVAATARPARARDWARERDPAQCRTLLDAPARVH